MDIKQLKINGVAFYPKVPVEAIVSVDGDTGAVDTTVQPNSDNLVTSGAVYTAIQGKSTTWTDVQGKPNFATVATSGSYNDLTDKPTIPSAMSVDDALNANSTNPVQNKVVNGAIGGLQQSISGVSSQLNNKLSSGDLKTVNGQSLVGSGNITIEGGGSTIEDYLKSISLDGTKITVTDSYGAAVAWEVNSPTITFAVADDNQTPGGTIQLNQRNDATIYLPAAVAGGTASVKSITLDDNGSASLAGEGSIYLQGLDGIKTKFNNNVISLYLEDQFKVDMQSALETAAQSLIDVGDLEERVAALEAIEPGEGGTSPSVYLKSITKSGNTYTIKDQANTETSWTIPTIPTIPTVNNSTVTFAIADAEHPAGGSFTLNQDTSATIYLPASTGEGGTTYIENPFDISQHSITELSDVDTSGTKDDGYTLVYNQSNGKWVPAAPFGGSLGSLSNVTITSPAEGQVLKFTGQKWENGTISAGSGDENVIETIKVNGTALTPDSNKAVDITVPNLNISTATPTNGQVLKWNGTQWAPATDNTSEGGGSITVDNALSNTSEYPVQNKVIASEISSLSSGINSVSMNKQNKLVSGTNIKSINNQSLLGSGNWDSSIELVDHAVDGVTQKTVQYTKLGDSQATTLFDIDYKVKQGSWNPVASYAVYTAIGDKFTSLNTKYSQGVDLTGVVNYISHSETVVGSDLRGVTSMSMTITWFNACGNSGQSERLNKKTHTFDRVAMNFDGTQWDPQLMIDELNNQNSTDFQIQGRPVFTFTEESSGRYAISMQLGLSSAKYQVYSISNIKFYYAENELPQAAPPSTSIEYSYTYSSVKDGIYVDKSHNAILVCINNYWYKLADLEEFPIQPND